MAVDKPIPFTPPRSGPGWSLLGFWSRQLEHSLNGHKSNGHRFFDEALFRELVTLERKRSDRSGRHLLLVLVHLEGLRGENGQLDPVLSDTVFSILSRCLRDTDLIGWYEGHRTLGALLTEILPERRELALQVVEEKINRTLSVFLPPEVRSRLSISLHLYPWDPEQPADGEDFDQTFYDQTFYPEAAGESVSRRVSLLLKRVMDVVLSVILLFVLLPLFGVIALAIKVNSRGPVLFRQVRAGKFGRRFVFLKFRSMYTDADPRVHQEFIEQFIRHSKEGKLDDPSLKPDGLFKLTRDPRVTVVGRFLRKTSLDELPQIWNVLRGDLSLVGPRPPIPYELSQYERWHHRRILEVKPGITGLWQVSGRSRTSFDDMVRLDLRYAKNWSLWLDFVLLLKTPWAVVKGDGAC